MSDIAQSKLIVLWEHEIRLAARMLVQVHQSELATKKNRSDEEDMAVSRLVFDALNACLAALHGADDPETVLVLSAVPDIRRPKREESAT